MSLPRNEGATRHGRLQSVRRAWTHRAAAGSFALCLAGLSLLPADFGGTAHAEGPCTCNDLDKLQAQLDRTTKSEEIWKEIFAWARGLHRDVNLPQSNDDLNQKFVQLTGAPASQWRDLIKQGPAQEKKTLKKVAGLSKEGETVLDEDFKKSNCDDIIDAEHVHEQAHRDFYLSFPQILEAGMSSRLLRLRAESEVEAYRAHKTFLEKKLSDLKLKCLTKLDKSTKMILEQAYAQRERLNQAEQRLRMYGNSEAALN
ncbi:protein of unknown function [Nitrospira japonica]|uniref:Uncharacterized protein n=1 Tax=Nitrospira japonica TaxID=1325564 RepID=A0A1W1I0K3_9BACT|nr:hypothetical protein [Nitrospira japonica]SLM46514.1 protein of unknown function [Nitrospira japonica]